MGKRDEDSWFYSGIKRRDFRADHGGGPEELPHRSPSKRGRKPRKGCPENNNKAHVYIKDEIIEDYTTPARQSVPGGWIITGLWTYEYKVKRTICVGCGHIKNREYDYEEYWNNRKFREYKPPSFVAKPWNW